MNDRASDFHFQLTDLPWLAVMLPESADGKHRGFIQALCLDLNGMTQTFRIKKGDYARSHDAQSSIFDNFRSIIRKGVV